MKTKGMGRRDFLKSSAAGLGGFIYLSSEKQPLKMVEDKKEEDKKLAYRVLGKTGIKLPVITMGVMNTDNPNLVRAALDAGMFHLDTGQTYQRGTQEARVGEVIKERSRDSFIIATKARSSVDQNTGLYSAEATEEAQTEKIDASLKNLGLDYVDIFYHNNVWVRETALYEPVLKALEKAKKGGKIRSIGISTHRNEPEVIQAAIDSKVYDVVLTAYNFRQQHAAEVKKAIARAAEAGLGVVAMKTIGGVRVMEKPGSESIDVKAALKWVLQDPNVSTIIAGFTTFDQMNMNLSIMKDMALTKREKESLHRATLVSGLYCQGCGKCVSQCAYQLPIPDLMRAYMYVYGYRNLGEAQDLLFSLNLPAEVCGDCASCPVECLNRWNISDRIRNVARLRGVPRDFIG
ncbi:MAG TPA: aldo/keto reductase [Thermodesulfobacteriota bacterium]|nr:aldo/keto reductase [Thermodesulfobacteriota bacterium]